MKLDFIFTYLPPPTPPPTPPQYPPTGDAPALERGRGQEGDRDEVGWGGQWSHRGCHHQGNLARSPLPGPGIPSLPPVVRLRPPLEVRGKRQDLSSPSKKMR